MRPLLERIFTWTLAALLLACASDTWVPADPSPVVPGHGARAEADGIQIELRTNAWTGQPSNLEQILPLLVEVRNRSGELIQLQYEEFWLESPTGRRYPALPPFDIDAPEVEPLRPYYPAAGFYLAPHLRSRFSQSIGHQHAFRLRSAHYRNHYPAFARYELPSPDMVARALLEGVLEPSGHVEGFLYFDPIPEEVWRVDFVFSPLATDERRLATLRIPLAPSD